MSFKIVTLEIDQTEWDKLRDMSAITTKAYLQMTEALPEIEESDPAPELAIATVAVQAALFAIIVKVGVHNAEAAVEIMQEFLSVKAFGDAEDMVAYVLDPENEGDDAMAQNAPSTDAVQ